MSVEPHIPTVLFLSADTGGGHRSAANAIRSAMHLIAPEHGHDTTALPFVGIDPNRLPFAPRDLLPSAWGGALQPWRAEIHETFQECGRYLLRKLASMYTPLVKWAPSIYAAYYHGTNLRATNHAMAKFVQSLLKEGLMALFTRLRPDVVVAMHPVLIKPSLAIMEEMRLRIPVLSIVTDLVRFHRSWAVPDVDVCTVPTRAAYDYVANLGVPQSKIHVLGMPIHPRFCALPVPPVETRHKLGLDQARFTVLLIGGGDGVGQVADIAYALATAHLPLQLIVVTGRNEALYRHLRTRLRSTATPAVVLGFTDEMAELMYASDVIITKAGPGTISEALACQLPIIISGAIPGQEVGNVAYVCQHGVGQAATSPHEVVEKVRRLSYGASPALTAMRTRAKELANPYASFLIAQMILSYLPRD